MSEVHPCEHIRYAIEAKGLIDKYKSELEKKDAEILEQARLLGKSAEREADLLGKLERKDKLCSELLQALKEADDKGLFS